MSELDHKREASEDSRKKYDLDVDRMLNEGLAGGYTTGEKGKQIEEAVDIRENDEPFDAPK
nr:hypothetical protein [Halalkalibacillus halophilus]